MSGASTYRIPMYTPTASGGHARYSFELLSAMAEHGDDSRVQVSLVTSNDLDPAFRTEAYSIHTILPPLRSRESFGSTFDWMLSRLRFYWRRDRTFVDWASQTGAAAVHLQEFTPWTAPFDLKRLHRRGIRVFATVHNIHWNTNPRFMPAWVSDASNRMVWRACDGLFVHSESLKRELSTFLGRNHPPIVVTPHGVWAVPRESSAESGDEGRLARKKLLFFGVISPYKGVDVLLQALEHLPDFSLVIAGESVDPAYTARLHELAAGLPPGRVVIKDRFIAENEIAPLFAESTLVVLPYTRFTSQSGVLHDAVAYGVPVVGTDVGAVGETIRGWGIGEVVAPGDVLALASGIRAATEPEAYAAATAAMDRVRTETSWRSAATVILDTYEQVLRGAA